MSSIAPGSAVVVLQCLDQGDRRPDLMPWNPLVLPELLQRSLCAKDTFALVPWWSGPLRVDNKLSNKILWMVADEEDTTPLRSVFQDIDSIRA